MPGPSFNLEQLSLTSQSLRRSEELVGRTFHIPHLPSRQYPYELVTLLDQEAAERAEGAFAHLVIYERQRVTGPEHLYRICLQDDVILRRLEEESSLRLDDLLIYALTHELVHVVRFQRAEHSFQADNRSEEESMVHAITLELLAESGEKSWQLLNSLFGNPVIPALRVPR